MPASKTIVPDLSQNAFNQAIIEARAIVEHWDRTTDDGRMDTDVLVAVGLLNALRQVEIARGAR